MRVSLNAFNKALQAFFVNKSNPHQVKASQMDTMSKGQVDTILDTKMRPGSIPISYFAANNVLNYDGNRSYSFATVDGAKVLTILHGGIKADNSYLTLSGYQFEVPGSLVVKPYDGSAIAVNSDILVYVQLKAGTPEYYYIAASTPIPVTVLNIPIYRLKMGNVGATLLTFVEKYDGLWIDGFTTGKNVTNGQTTLGIDRVDDPTTQAWIKEIRE